VVTFARNVGGHFLLIRQLHTRHLAERRVRLLGRRRVDARADTALLRVALQRRRLVTLFNRSPTLADQLVDRGHLSLALCSGFPAAHRRRSDDFYWQKNAGTHPHSGSPHGRKRLALATAISCAAVSRTFHLADRLGNSEAGGPGVKWAEH